MPGAWQGLVNLVDRSRTGIYNYKIPHYQRDELPDLVVLLVRNFDAG